jgi:AcrR family transcriptional regulator
MGRIAGVTAAETRARLLDAAAEVFAARGYEGTRVADIARAAGVSNGALYTHFASKAELLVESLRTRGPRLLAEVLRADPDGSIADLLLAAGRSLPGRRAAGGYLIVEALVAARRDPQVARLMRADIGARTDWLADLVRIGQLAGELHPDLSPDAIAHFCLLLVLGSALLPSTLHGVDPQEWGRLLQRVVASLVATSEEGAPE